MNPEKKATISYETEKKLRESLDKAYKKMLIGLNEGKSVKVVFDLRGSSVSAKCNTTEITTEILYTEVLD